MRMAPITMVFIITGLAVFTQAMFFLGIGASAEEGKAATENATKMIQL